MNDGYLVKAKRIDNGEWVVGSYVYTFAPDKECPVVGLMKENHFIVEENGHICIIDPSTICQCTGLKDENGNLVYENDVVMVHIGSRTTICEVKYADNVAHFQLWQKNTLPHTPTALNLGNYFTEIIGNVFDNPELMEVE